MEQRLKIQALRLMLCLDAGLELIEDRDEFPRALAARYDKLRRIMIRAEMRYYRRNGQAAHRYQWSSSTADISSGVHAG